jgi:hypothetical protein
MSGNGIVRPPGLLNRLLGRSDIHMRGSPYMERWQFVDRPSFGARVHHILRSDWDRALHDHPWDFTSVILTGGYYEHRPINLKLCTDDEVQALLDAGSTIHGCTGSKLMSVRTWHGPGSILRRRAEDLHRIELKKELVATSSGMTPVDIPAWTFVMRGRERRDWGFKLDDGWVSAKLFHSTHKEDT